MLSTHFNDVRLKNFIEMRHWDSLPIERAELLTQIVSNLFYDVERRTSLESYFSGLTGEDVHAAKAVLQARGETRSPTTSRWTTGPRCWVWAMRSQTCRATRSGRRCGRGRSYPVRGLHHAA